MSDTDERNAFDAAAVNDLFQALRPEDVWDVTTKDREWIIIHFNGPDGDHRALWIEIDGGRWELRESPGTGDDATLYPPDETTPRR